MDSKTATIITEWYKNNSRELPWRTDRSAYSVWISEIMLQQTRVEAVIPYYARFMENFPDVFALAAAEEGFLLKIWQGLGYYSRARNLKKAAQIIVSEYGGVLPKDIALLKKLPGIGEYTAGAIASIAYGMPAPAVDGNVLRILMRLWASDEDVLSPTAKKKATGALQKIYPNGDEARLFTEGLMELGQTICLPNGEPKCGNCPSMRWGCRRGSCLLRPQIRARHRGIRKKTTNRKICISSYIELYVFSPLWGNCFFLTGKKMPPSGQG